MNDITIPTSEEIAAQLRLQIRNQIKQVQQIKSTVSRSIVNLQQAVNREDTITAFGTEMPEILAAIAVL